MPLTEAKAAYSGVFPSVDLNGHMLSGIRGRQAGKKLAGGPYALTSIRLALWNKIPYTVLSKFFPSWGNQIVKWPPNAWLKIHGFLY